MAQFIDTVTRDVAASIAQAGGLDGAWDVLNSISREMGYGNDNSRYSDYFYGINRMNNMMPLPHYKENQGLVLFTKPHLNLSYDNIATVRKLGHFFTQDPTTYQYAIRMMLDPITYRTAKQSNLVNPYDPYLTLLTNSVMTMTQPPDMALNIYSSPEGFEKEVWIMNDGIAEQNGRYDLTFNFNNSKGNPGIALFSLWIMYIGFLRTGPLVPHPDQRAQDEIDYQTRIERYKFDDSGRYITGWFHTGIAIPTNVSIGAGFDYNREEGSESTNKSYSVQFACAGAEYNDPIQLLEFNMRVISFQPKMGDAVRKQYFTLVPKEALARTNYNGYPRINLATQEMEWWIENEIYQTLIKRI